MKTVMSVKDEFGDRLGAQAAAKKALLEKFRAKAN